MYWQIYSTAYHGQRRQ